MLRFKVKGNSLPLATLSRRQSGGLSLMGEAKTTLAGGLMLNGYTSYSQIPDETYQ